MEEEHLSAKVVEQKMNVRVGVVAHALLVGVVHVPLGVVVGNESPLVEEEDHQVWGLPFLAHEEGDHPLEADQVPTNQVCWPRVDCLKEVVPNCQVLALGYSLRAWAQGLPMGAVLMRREEHGQYPLWNSLPVVQVVG